MVSAGDGHDLDQLRARLVQNAKRRISEWPDREAAFSYLRTRPGMMGWDERVLKVFVVCGSICAGCMTVHNGFGTGSCDREIAFRKWC